MTKPWLTPRLASWLADVRIDDVPQSTRDEVALRIMDSLGVAFAARGETAVRALVSQTPAVQGEGGVPLVGLDRTADVRDAALINGTMGHVLDFDDSVLPSRLHPSAGLTAGLMALGHHWDLSGDDLLLGFATGFEVAVRLADAIHPQAYDAGWHNAGVLTPLAVAAGGAVMANADQRTIEHVLGIAASSSGGLLSNRGSMTKSLHTGRGAWSGVMAVLLALDGFTSRPGSLDAAPGGQFLQLFGGHPDRVDIDGLGGRWSIVRSAIKPYACGVVAHPAIDAAIALRDRPGVDPRTVQSLTVTVPTVTLQLMGDRAPTVGLEAKFSVPFVVAAALVHGHGGPSLFEGDVAADPTLVRIMECISVVIDDSLSQQQARVDVLTADGATESVSIKAALGSTANPMGDSGVRGKFRALFAAAGETERGRTLEKVLSGLGRHRVRDLTASV